METILFSYGTYLSGVMYIVCSNATSPASWFIVLYSPGQLWTNIDKLKLSERKEKKFIVTNRVHKGWKIIIYGFFVSGALNSTFWSFSWA